MRQRLIAVFFGLGFAGAMCSAANRSDDGGWNPSVSTPVCTSRGDQQSPALSLSDGRLLVVWQDSRPDGKASGTRYPWSVYGRYLKGGRELPIHLPPDSSAMHPDVSGNTVVWVHHRGWSNLLMTTLKVGRPGDIKTIEGCASAPSIDGRLVVWGSSKNRYEAGQGNIAWITDIRAFELAGPGIAFDVTNSDRVPQSGPSASGTVVAWQDLHHGSGGWSSGFLHYRNIDTDAEPLRVAGIRDKKAANCAVSGGFVVWQDNRNGDWDIYGLDIRSGRQWEICRAPGDQTHPAVRGPLVVWQDSRNGEWDIYGYDLRVGTVCPVYVGRGNQTEPAIYGDVVVWTDDRGGEKDIYMNQRKGGTSVKR